MKHNKLAALIIAMVFFAFLNSCDPVVDYEKAIVNSSINDLLLVRNNPIPFNDEDVSYSESILLDSVLLQANNFQLLTKGFDIGGSIEAYTDCPGLEEDSIFVFVGSGANRRLALTITQNEFANKYRKLEKNRCECVFEITDEMIN